MTAHLNETTPIAARGIFRLSRNSRQSLPLYVTSIPAGFPSPADDYIDRALDFNEYLVRHPAATFCVRVSGDSMIHAGINSGDVLVVDRSIEPGDGKIVIAAVDGELTVKRLCREGDRLYLVPANPDFDPMEIRPETAFEIWGVVTHVIHTV